jgi:hypothetical protein
MNATLAMQQRKPIQWFKDIIAPAAYAIGFGLILWQGFNRLDIASNADLSALKTELNTKLEMRKAETKQNFASIEASLSELEAETNPDQE